MFIKRFRKDYINFRNYLIRYMSTYFYYEHLKKAALFAVLSTESDPALGGKKPDVVNFRAKWDLNLYLNHKKEKAENMGYVYALCYMFKEKYKGYYKYINLKINLYNKVYTKNVQTYKLRVLNRISNLKRFFYYRNKRFSGWAI